MRLGRLRFFILSLIIGSPSHVFGQAVQAYQDLRSHEKPSPATSADNTRGQTLRDIAHTANGINDYVAQTKTLTDSQRVALQALSAEAVSLLDSDEDTKALDDDLTDIRRRALAISRGVGLSIATFHGTEEVTATIPQVQQVSKSVSFVAAASITTSEAKSIKSFDLSTNLLGAAVGTAFDALGSDALKSFFTSNLSAGTSLPVGGQGRIAGNIGLGLGGVNFGFGAFWPVLGLTQYDSTDTRVPRGLVTRRDSVENWSQPQIAVAIVPKFFLDNLKAGKPAAILTLGATLPFYYPGDPFSAMASLFSTKRNNFEREGKAHFTIGLAVPLFKVGE